MLLSAERGRIDLGEMLSDDDDAAIAAVTAAELFTGVEFRTRSVDGVHAPTHGDSNVCLASSSVRQMFSNCR